MLQNFWDNFRIVRRIKGGEWYKTKYRGWIRPELFQAYLNHGFSPVLLRWERYENFIRK